MKLVDCFCKEPPERIKLSTLCLLSILYQLSNPAGLIQLTLLFTKPQQTSVASKPGPGPTPARPNPNTSTQTGTHLDTPHSTEFTYFLP